MKIKLDVYSVNQDIIQQTNQHVNNVHQEHIHRRMVQHHVFIVDVDHKQQVIERVVSIVMLDFIVIKDHNAKHVQ